MLPVLLLLLQLPLILDGPVWAVGANALALAGALYAAPEARPALDALAREWRRPAAWRQSETWTTLAFAHVAAVPPWFFLRPADAPFAFPGLYLLGIGLGLARLVKHLRLAL